MLSLPLPCVQQNHMCSPEGPRMVRDVFHLAKENGLAIIFIDEVNTIATTRFNAQTGAGREVQRILMELLNQARNADHRTVATTSILQNSERLPLCFRWCFASICWRLPGVVWSDKLADGL